MTKNTIVGDSSLLIALSIIQQLELLPKLYQRVVIPESMGRNYCLRCWFTRRAGNKST